MYVDPPQPFSRLSTHFWRFLPIFAYFLFSTIYTILTIFPCFHSFLIIFYILQLPLPTFNHYQPFLHISFIFDLSQPILYHFEYLFHHFQALPRAYTHIQPFSWPTTHFQAQLLIFAYFRSFFFFDFNHYLQPSFTTSNHLLAIFTNTYSFQQPVTTPSHFRPFELEQAYTHLWQPHQHQVNKVLLLEVRKWKWLIM